jgi:GNAT superfamily N-acetyltransferase
MAADYGVADLSGSLVRLERRHIRQTSAMLGRAFRNYPLVPYYFPDQEHGKKVASLFGDISLYSGLKYGEVYLTSPAVEGVAIWIPSENYPLSIFQLFRSVPLNKLFEFAISGGARLSKVGSYLDKQQRRLAPFRHHYLSVLGVDPLFQGQGFSSKLVKPILARLDKAGLPCYLETQDEKDVAIYQHFGFGVVEATTVPGTSLMCWAMLRHPPKT